MRRFLVAAGTVLALSVASTLGGSSAQVEQVDRGGSGQEDRVSTGAYQSFRGLNVDSASSAQPSEADPHVRDTSQDSLRTRNGTAKADATATSSADCDGCTGEATTVQVVYFDGRRGIAAADNVASAWSACVDCSASAVSVQVLVVPRRDTVKVNNRAVALNASCSACSTSAVALQFVFSGGPGRRLSSAAEDLVADVKTELADRLDSAAKNPKTSGAGPAHAAKTRTAADDAAERLERIIVRDLGAGTVEHFLDVEVGS